MFSYIYKLYVFHCRARSNKQAGDGDKWSGDATKYKTSFNYTEGSISVSLNEDQRQTKEAPKQQPVWMTTSTVEGAPVEADTEVRRVVRNRL